VGFDGKDWDGGDWTIQPHPPGDILFDETPR
jgi:hypothetical protein